MENSSSFQDSVSVMIFEEKVWSYKTQSEVYDYFIKLETLGKSFNVQLSLITEPYRHKVFGHVLLKDIPSEAVEREGAKVSLENIVKVLQIVATGTRYSLEQFANDIKSIEIVNI